MQINFAKMLVNNKEFRDHDLLFKCVDFDHCRYILL